jgi:hypothetical protein
VNTDWIKRLYPEMENRAPAIKMPDRGIVVVDRGISCCCGTVLKNTRYRGTQHKSCVEVLGCGFCVKCGLSAFKMRFCSDGRIVFWDKEGAKEMYIKKMPKFLSLMGGFNKFLQRLNFL